MLFSEHLLEDIASPESLSRGQRYYWENRVLRVAASVNRNGQISLTGRVRGEKVYQTRLVLSANRLRIESYQCSCPFDYDGACKHVVALGLAGMAKELPTNVAEVNHELSVNHETRTSQQVADEQGEAVRLAQLGLQPVAVTTPTRRPVVSEFGLEGFRLQVSYDRLDDVVTLQASVQYGPFEIPLLEDLPPQELQREKRGRIERALRDYEMEEEAHRSLAAHFGWSEDHSLSRFNVRGDDIYWLVKSVLPDLSDRFVLDMDPSMDRVLDIGRSNVASEWNTERGAREGWFDFAVAWHCGQTQVKLEQLRDMVESHRPFIRLEDGSFVECDNREEVKRLLDVVDQAEETADGHYRSRLFFAPETMDLLARSQAARLASTDAAFKAFLQETQSGKPIERIRLPATLEKVMRPYQIEGVSWIMFLRKYGFGGILADDMGLGKTLQVLAAILLTKKTRKAPWLVVCPKTLTLTWAKEAANFTPELSVLVVDGGLAGREQLRQNIAEYDLVITPYSLMVRDALHYAERKLPFDCCVLDEAQYIKNAETATAQAVKLIPATHHLALTGTPLENGVHELWSVFDFLMPGFLGSAREFRVQYERPIHERQDSLALEKLKRKARPFLLRRTKETQLKDLPPKIEQTSFCALTPEQLVTYTRALEAVRRDVFSAVDNKGFQRSRIEILSALMKLRRICDHPCLADPRLPRGEELSGKLALLLELVQEATDGGHKILVFSQFTSMLDLIREALERRSIGHCTIEGRTRDRQAEIRRFSEDPSVRVFLLSLKAGGVGLTLTEADTVILVDPWWNPQVERQAMDRAHRIGQSKTVNVYKLVTQNTVEEKVTALQVKKQQIFDALMEENAQAIKALTWEDVRGLFE